MMESIGIGILGFGTVGAGVAQGLQQQAELLRQRVGVPLELRRIADLDIESDRGVSVDRSLLTTDAAAVVAADDVDVVVELIGGTGVARQLTLEALRRGKPVVTANKALLAEHGEELYAAAAGGGADLLFEASVAGGIPIIRSLREGLIGNRIERICGILNGTCNYILTRMEHERLPFDQVLAEAQAAGYAEAEPSLDIDGLDTAHKAVVLATQAYGRPVRMADVPVSGVRGIEAMDIAGAVELGYRIKLLAVIEAEGDEMEVRVHPALVPLRHMLASVSGVFNAVLATGDMVGETVHVGRGAGREPTASAVIGDIADAARNLALGVPARMPAFTALRDAPRLRPAAESRTRAYLRMSLTDVPGMLAVVTRILGEHGISLASVLQKEASTGAPVPVVMLTHEARVGDLQAALAQVDALAEVSAPTIWYRIEDFA
jgi:homoserine dehydrogenase